MSQLFACRPQYLLWSFTQVLCMYSSSLRDHSVLCNNSSTDIFETFPRDVAFVLLVALPLPCKFSESTPKVRDKSQISLTFAQNCNILSAVILQNETLVSSIMDDVGEQGQIGIQYTYYAC